MTLSVSAWAKVPGKVIIAGEHAVIYDQPAIASAINLSTLATCQWRWAPKYTGVLTLNLPQYQWQVKYPIEQLLPFSQGVIGRHQAFLEGKLKHQQVLPQHGDLLIAALGYAAYLSAIHELDELSALVDHGDITIDITTDLLLGAGMGASASLVAACLAALLDAAQLMTKLSSGGDSLALKDLSRSQRQNMLFDLTYACEQWQHGRSSGLDPKVCIYGGGWLMQQGKSAGFNMPAINGLFLVNTGIPQSSTGACVDFVAKQSASIVWHTFAEQQAKLAIILKSASHLDIKTTADFLLAISENQRLLEAIGVVPSKVMTFVKAIEKQQGVAKISGAGSVQGDNAGLLLVGGMSEQALATLCASYDYNYWVFQPQGHGMQFSHETNQAVGDG